MRFKPGAVILSIVIPPIVAARGPPLLECRIASPRRTRGLPSRADNSAIVIPETRPEPRYSSPGGSRRMHARLRGRASQRRGGGCGRAAVGHGDARVRTAAHRRLPGRALMGGRDCDLGIPADVAARGPGARRVHRGSRAGGWRAARVRILVLRPASLAREPHPARPDSGPSTSPHVRPSRESIHVPTNSRSQTGGSFESSPATALPRLSRQQPTDRSPRSHGRSPQRSPPSRTAARSSTSPTTRQAPRHTRRSACRC